MYEHQRGRMRPPKDSFRQKSKSPNYLLWIGIAVVVIAACVGGWFLYRHFSTKDNNNNKQVQPGNLQSSEHVQSDITPEPQTIEQKTSPNGEESELDIEVSKTPKQKTSTMAEESDKAQQTGAASDGFFGTGITGTQAAIGAGALGTTALTTSWLANRNSGNSDHSVQLAKLQAEIESSKREAETATTELRRQAEEHELTLSEAAQKLVEAQEQADLLRKEHADQYVISPQTTTFTFDLIIMLGALIATLGITCFLCKTNSTKTGNITSTCTNTHCLKRMGLLVLGIGLAGASWWFVVKNYYSDGLKNDNLIAKRCSADLIKSDWNNANAGFLAPVDCALATRNSMVDTFGTGMVKVKEHVTHKVYEIFNDDYGRIPSTLIESVPIEYYRPWVTSMFMQMVMLPNYLFTFKGTTNELWASTKEVCTASCGDKTRAAGRWICAWFKPLAWTGFLYMLMRLFWKLTPGVFSGWF